MLDEELKKHLLLALEYSYKHDDWVEPADVLLSGLSADQAKLEIQPDWPSIWSIVLHVAVWNENIIERIETGQNTHPSEGAWPAIPEPADDAAWAKSRDRFQNSLDDLAEFIRSTTVEKIQASPYGLADMLVRFTHIGYHLGQITKLRPLVESLR